LGLLVDTLEEAAQGKGRFLLLSGEAGMGKSRLLAELRRRAGDGWAFLTGHCYKQDISFPFCPWADALQRHLVQDPSAKFRELPGGLAAQLSRLLPELDELIPEPAVQSSLDAEEEKRRLFNAVLQLLLRTSATRPVLVAIEDVHWSDEASLDLLRFLVRRIASYPVLIVATYRSDEILPGLSAFLAEMDRERAALEIRLASLTRPEVEEMVGGLLGQSPAELQDLLGALLPLVEGNPFYIEEILQSLVGSGALARSGGTWTRKVNEKLSIPRSILETVQGRTAQLSPEAHELLTLTAVAGQQFELRLLEALTGESEAVLLGEIRELMAAQLIVETSPERFAFRHALTREAVYTALLGREQRNLHRRIGETMEQVYAGVLEPHLPELAYHFYESGSWQPAYAYAQKAAQVAQALYAPREAATHYTHALEAAQQMQLTPPFACLTGRARAYEMLGDFDRAQADYVAALDIAQANRDPAAPPEAQWQALISLGFLWHSRDFRRSGVYFHQALEFAERLGDPAILGRTLNRLGNWRLNQNQPFEAREQHEKALKLFEELGDRHGIAETLDLLAIAQYQCGGLLQGEALYDRAMRLWEELGARQNLVQSLVHVGFPVVIDTEIYHAIDADRLRGQAETALRIAREMGWRNAEVEAFVALGELAFAGEYTLALESLFAGMEIAREMNHQYFLTLAGSSIGNIYLELFNLEEARQYLSAALEVAVKSSATVFILRCTALLASEYLLDGDLGQAANLLKGVLPEWAARMPLAARLAWKVRAHLALAQGEPDLALQIADRLIETTENGPATGDKAVAALAKLRGEALVVLGRPDEAACELRSAADLAERQKRVTLLWRAQAALGRLYLAEKRSEEAREALMSARRGIEQLAERVPGQLRENFLRRALAEIPPAYRPGLRPAGAERPGGLTRRELEVAALIARGKSNREIATELFVGVRTVEAHITRILTRLGFTSRTEIAVWAAGKGMNPPGER
jgi:DNA-binding CsgD family transcriptional regulator